MKMDVYTIPDFVSKEEIEAIYQQTSVGLQRPWTFSGDVIGLGGSSRSVPGICFDMTDDIHVYKSWNQPIRPELFEPGCELACEILDSFESRGSPVGVHELYRFRFNYLFNSLVDGYHDPHVDDSGLCADGVDHWVCVIQLIGDGPTYVFDRRWGQDQSDDEPYQLIEFKPGNAIIFPGDRYHSSSSPVKSQCRLAININLG